MYRKRVALIFLLFCNVLLMVEAKTIYLPKRYIDGKMILTQDMIKDKNTTFIIKHQYDLLGAIINLPEGSVLKFGDNGQLANGTLVGSNSSLITKSSAAIFNDISITGIWDVAEISSNLFIFNSNNPELNTRNFMSMCMLTSNGNKGVIHIVNGAYNIKLDEAGKSCFNLNSDTELIIDGDIILEGNALEFYQIIQIKNKENVKVHGSGSLIGDVDSHLGTTGEWGMGIAILDSDNIEIRDLTIMNCWGDCIYIGQVGYNKESYSQGVVIEDVVCKAGRRQGMSIISGKDIYVRHSKFLYTGSIKYTAPGAGIDIEPNILGNTIVDNIVIEDCEFYGNSNERDFLTYNLDTTANVVLRNSRLKGDLFLGKGSYNITVDSCELKSILTPQANYGNINIKNSVITTRTKVDKSVIIDNCYYVGDKPYNLVKCLAPYGLAFIVGTIGVFSYVKKCYYKKIQKKLT